MPPSGHAACTVDAVGLDNQQLVQAPVARVWDALTSGVHHLTEFTLAPAPGNATRLAMSFTAVQAQANPMQRVLWAVVGRLGAKATEKLMAKDLQDIAARAERP